MKPTPLFFLSASQSPATSASPAPQGTATSDSRSTEFRAVEGGNVMQSGEKLLVEAYAAMWLLTFVLVYLSWRRQSKTDERITNLEAAVSKAQREATSAAKAAKSAAKAAKASGGSSAAEGADA